jgi:hypothetical protein
MGLSLTFTSFSLNLYNLPSTASAFARMLSEARVGSCPYPAFAGEHLHGPVFSIKVDNDNNVAKTSALTANGFHSSNAILVQTQLGGFYCGGDVFP